MLPFNMDISDEKRIKRELIETNRRLKMLTSFKFNFFMSIIKGVGTILGATIIFAIVLAILDRVIEALGGVPLLQRLIDIGMGNVT
jgi:hypothetical protein